MRDLEWRREIGGITLDPDFLFLERQIHMTTPLCPRHLSFLVQKLNFPLHLSFLVQKLNRPLGPPYLGWSQLNRPFHAPKCRLRSYAGL